MSDSADVPPAVVGRLRVICGELPEAYEEPAWIGLRWRIRRRTFLHVYTTDEQGSAYIDLDDPANDLKLFEVKVSVDWSDVSMMPVGAGQDSVMTASASTSSRQSAPMTRSGTRRGDAPASRTRFSMPA